MSTLQTTMRSVQSARVSVFFVVLLLVSNTFVSAANAHSPSLTNVVVEPSSVQQAVSSSEVPTVVDSSDDAPVTQSVSQQTTPAGEYEDSSADEAGSSLVPSTEAAVVDSSSTEPSVVSSLDAADNLKDSSEEEEQAAQELEASSKRASSSKTENTADALSETQTTTTTANKVASNAEVALDEPAELDIADNDEDLDVEDEEVVRSSEEDADLADEADEGTKVDEASVMDDADDDDLVADEDQDQDQGIVSHHHVTKKPAGSSSSSSSGGAGATASAKHSGVWLTEEPQKADMGLLRNTDRQPELPSEAADLVDEDEDMDSETAEYAPESASSSDYEDVEGSAGESGMADEVRDLKASLQASNSEEESLDEAHAEQRLSDYNTAIEYDTLRNEMAHELGHCSDCSQDVSDMQTSDVRRRIVKGIRNLHKQTRKDAAKLQTKLATLHQRIQKRVRQNTADQTKTRRSLKRFVKVMRLLHARMLRTRSQIDNRSVAFRRVTNRLHAALNQWVAWYNRALATYRARRNRLENVKKHHRVFLRACQKFGKTTGELCVTIRRKVSQLDKRINRFRTKLANKVQKKHAKTTSVVKGIKKATAAQERKRKQAVAAMVAAMQRLKRKLTSYQVHVRKVNVTLNDRTKNLAALNQQDRRLARAQRKMHATMLKRREALLQRSHALLAKIQGKPQAQTQAKAQTQAQARSKAQGKRRRV